MDSECKTIDGRTRNQWIAHAKPQEWKCKSGGQRFEG